MSDVAREPFSMPELERLVRFALRLYQGHHEWDDLLQIGRIGAWKEIHGPAITRCAPSTAAVKGAVWAVTAYFRSRACHPADYHRSDGRCRDIVWISTDEGEPGLTARDFAEESLRRLETNQVIERLRHSCTPRQWQLIELVYLQELPVSDAARALGLAPISVRQTIRRAFNNFRRREFDESSTPYCP